ncbi:MAG: hypothetical protein O7F73_09685 [Gammaproteobacteria bacterium]|nr:hypothetical protein [Gammaproteobacteria bacterium]
MKSEIPFQACKASQIAGIYIEPEKEQLRFRQVAPPTAEELHVLLHRITHRVARYLD